MSLSSGLITYICFSLTAVFLIFSIGWELRRLSQLGKLRQVLNKRIDMLKRKDGLFSVADKHDYLWAKEHFTGTNQEGRFKVAKDFYDDRFQMIKYPDEIAVIPKSVTRFVPPILTAIGILGTFWGITVGLEGVNIDPNNTADSLKSATELINGMQTAFYTSLAGLGASVFLSIILSLIDKLHKNGCVATRNKLFDIAVMETSEKYLANLNFESATQATTQLANLAKEFNAQAIGVAVGRVVGEKISEAIDRSLKPTFVRIQETNSNLEVLMGDQRQTLANLIGEMRSELITPVAQRLDQSGELLNKSSYSLDQAALAIKTLNTDLAGIAKELGDSSLVLERFQRETVQHLQTFISSLKEVLDQFRTETSHALTETAEQLKSGTVEILHEARQTFQEQNTVLQAIGEEATKLMDNSRAQLVQSLKETELSLTTMSTTTQSQLEQFKQLYEQSLETFFSHFQQESKDALAGIASEIRTGTSDMMHEARQTFQEQNTVLQAIGEEATHLMSSARSSLMEGLEGIDSRLQEMNNQTQEQLTQFREAYQHNLQEFFDRQNNLLDETVGKQRDGLAEVVRELNASFTNEFERRKEINAQVEHQLDLFQKNAHKAMQLASTIENSYSVRMQQLTEISELVQDQVERIEQSNIRIDTTHKQSYQALEQLLKQMIEGETKFFDQADSAMAKISSGLLEAAQILIEVKK